MNVEIDRDILLRQAHQTTDAEGLKVGASYPNSEVIVHKDLKCIEDMESEQV